MESIFDMPFDGHSATLHGIDRGDDVLMTRVHQIVRKWQYRFGDAYEEARHTRKKVDEDGMRRRCAAEVTTAIEKRILERHVGLLC